MRDAMLKNAIELLNKNNATCIVLIDDRAIIRYDRGVKPLLDFIDEKCNIKGGIVADKVVGKAAAMLYIVLEIKELYACVISEHALEILEKYGIEVTYAQKVSMIRNRSNTGFCPMEQSVLKIDTPTEAVTAIRCTLKKLQSLEK